MPTVNLQIAEDADDGHLTVGFGLSPGGVSLAMGRDGFIYHAWLRFVNVTVPQAATITAATLVITGKNGESTAVELLIDGNDADNAANPVSEAGFDAMARTTAAVAWDFSTTWTADVEFTSPDISTVIQEVVDRAGWASGNALIVFVRNDLGAGADNRRIGQTYAGAPAKSAKLNITYAGSGGKGSGGKGGGGKPPGGSQPPGKLKTFGIRSWPLGRRRLWD